MSCDKTMRRKSSIVAKAVCERHIKCRLSSELRVRVHAPRTVDRKVFSPPRREAKASSHCPDLMDKVDDIFHLNKFFDGNFNQVRARLE